ncbi:MAG: hypothetical protein RLO52_34575 [Sandaracinaceae bacterium]
MSVLGLRRRQLRARAVELLTHFLQHAGFVPHAGEVDDLVEAIVGEAQAVGEPVVVAFALSGEAAERLVAEHGAPGRVSELLRVRLTGALTRPGSWEAQHVEALLAGES